MPPFGPVTSDRAGAHVGELFSVEERRERAVGDEADRGLVAGEEQRLDWVRRARSARSSCGRRSAPPRMDSHPHPVIERNVIDIDR
jgi:hypothetical protein